ncbi:hypothetical protein UlMin_017623 [Ulmus minor]
MDSTQGDEAVLIPKSKSKGKVAAVDASPPPPPVTTKATALKRIVGWKKCVAIVDFLLRLSGCGAAFAAVAAFHAEYNDLPTLTYAYSFTLYVICRLLSTINPIMYLAHNGNADANWIAICQQFTEFCQQISGAVVASFVTAVILIFLVMVSAFALTKTTSH